jgi:hypothetical protein
MSLRRLGRGVALGWKWLRYLRPGPQLAVRLRDFGSWAETTFREQPPLEKDLPWITYPAKRWLQEWLRPGMTVFEWGSGGSTVFLARRVSRVVSVEYDPVWWSALREAVASRGLANVELKLVVPEPVEEGAEPYSSSDPAFAGRGFRRYVETVLAPTDEPFDLVLVDGRARARCVEAARSRLKPGGVLILDDSERFDAVPALPFLPAPEWAVRHFEGPGPSSLWPAFWRTSAYSREPSSLR